MNIDMTFEFMESLATIVCMLLAFSTILLIRFFVKSLCQMFTNEHDEL